MITPIRFVGLITSLWYFDLLCTRLSLTSPPLPPTRQEAHTLSDTFGGAKCNNSAQSGRLGKCSYTNSFKSSKFYQAWDPRVLERWTASFRRPYISSERR